MSSSSSVGVSPVLTGPEVGPAHPLNDLVRAGEPVPDRVPLGGVLTPRMERFIRIGSVGSALIIAVSAMVLSYAGLHDLALDAQIHPRLALLVPIMVDGLQFVGSLGVVYSTLSGLRAWYPWLLMLMGVSISAWGNWQAAPDAMTAKLLHAAAPVILALVLEELLRVMRHKVSLHALARRAALAEAEVAVDTRDEAAPQAVVPVSAAEPVHEPVCEPVTVEKPLGEPVNEPEVASQSPRPVPQPEEAVPSAQTPLSAPESAAESASESASEPALEPAPEATFEATVSANSEVQVETGNLDVEVEVEPLAVVTTSPDEALPASNTGVQEDRQPRPEESASVTVLTEEDEETLPDYPAEGTFKEQVRAILLAEPDIAAAKIARVMGKDDSYTRKIVREARAELDEEAEQPTIVDLPPQPVRTQRQQPTQQATQQATQMPAPGRTQPPAAAPVPAATAETATTQQMPLPTVHSEPGTHDGEGDDLGAVDPFAVSTRAFATN